MYIIFFTYYSFSFTSESQNKNYKRKLATENSSLDFKKIRVSEVKSTSTTQYTDKHDLNLEILSNDNVLDEDTDMILNCEKNISSIDFGISPCKECLQLKESTGVSLNTETPQNEYCIIFKKSNQICSKCKSILSTIDIDFLGHYAMFKNLRVCHYICFEIRMKIFFDSYNNSEDKLAFLGNEFVTFKSFNTFIYNIYSYIKIKYDINTTNDDKLNDSFNHLFKIEGIYDIFHSIIEKIERIKEIQKIFISEKENYQNFLTQTNLNHMVISRNNLYEKFYFDIKYSQINFNNIFENNIHTLKPFYNILYGNSLKINNETVFKLKYQNFNALHKINYLTLAVESGEYKLGVSYQFFNNMNLEFLIITIHKYDTFVIDSINKYKFNTKSLYIQCVNQPIKKYEICSRLACFFKNILYNSIIIENMNLFFLYRIFLIYVDKLPYLENFEIVMWKPEMCNSNATSINKTQNYHINILKNFILNIPSSISCRDLYMLVELSKKLFPRNSFLIKIISAPIYHTSPLRQNQIDELFHGFNTLNKLVFISTGELGWDEMNTGTNQIFNRLFRMTKTLHFKIKKFPHNLYTITFRYTVLEKIIISDSEISLHLFLWFLEKCDKICSIEINECNFIYLEKVYNIVGKKMMDIFCVNGVDLHEIIYIFHFFMIKELIISNLKQKNVTTLVMPTNRLILIDKIIVIGCLDGVIMDFLKIVKYKKLHVKDSEVLI